MSLDLRWSKRTDGKGKAHLLEGSREWRQSMCGVPVGGLNLIFAWVLREDACKRCSQRLRRSMPRPRNKFTPEPTDG